MEQIRLATAAACDYKPLIRTCLCFGFGRFVKAFKAYFGSTGRLSLRIFHRIFERVYCSRWTGINT